MKLSIWQQFSSNHSAHYTIIGKFAAEEDTKGAAKKIEDILMEILVAREQLPENFRGWGGGKATPVEQHIGEQYGFDWKETIDWLWAMYHNRKNPLKQLNQWDEYVAIDSTWNYTWQTGHQFKNLMIALGGQVYSDVYQGHTPDSDYEVIYKSIICTFSCITPSESKAQELATKIRDHISDNTNIHHPKTPPWDWMTYHPEFQTITNGLSIEPLRKLELIFIDEHRRLFEAPQPPEFSQPFKRINPDTIDQAKKQREQHRRKFITQDDEIVQMIWQLRDETQLSSSTEIKQSATTLTLSLNYMRKGWILIPTLLKWIENEGCSVTYHLSEKTS